MKLLKGTDLVDYISERQAKQIRALKQSRNIYPKLAIISCNPKNLPSQTYIKLKAKRADELGLLIDVHQVIQPDVRELISYLNEDPSVHGIILQLPLGDTQQTEELLALISPKKDVDGLNPRSSVVPATVGAILWLLAGYNVDLKNKKVLVIGKGKLVGAPLIAILEKETLNLTSLDKNNSSEELDRAIKDSDIIITATGQPKLITPDKLKDRQVIIDAGTNEINGKLVGDLDPKIYDSKLDIKVTAQKGGLGPLTISYLFENLLQLIDNR